jgi:YD repeat-containing protein
MARTSKTSHFQFGKRAAKRDKRNLKLAAILRAPVSLPAEYDFDVSHAAVPTPMFGNDTLGDCVIAGRAHQTLRFEWIEQKTLIAITDTEVKRQYFKETGGPDSGLVVLDSLKSWRRTGWIAATKRYKIKAFAEINATNQTEVKRAVFMDVGVGLGLSLPNAAMPQFHAGKPWEVVAGPNGKPNPNNGHYVYVSGYTQVGPVCVTWGRKQQMTWAFLQRYCDEAYAIIDDVNTTKKRRGLNEKQIEAFLATLN